MGRGMKVFAAIVVALFAGVYQLYVKQLLALTGIYPARQVQSIGSKRCEAVRGMEACESTLSYPLSVGRKTV